MLELSMSLAKLSFHIIVILIPGRSVPIDAKIVLVAGRAIYGEGRGVPVDDRVVLEDNSVIVVATTVAPVNVRFIPR
jgi:hypothetical protein